MVKKVLYFEKEKFLRSMFEKVLRNLNTDVYTAESFKENSYLIDDIKPDLIIFDYSTCADGITQLLNSKFKLLVTINDDSQQEHLAGLNIAFLKKPIEARGIGAVIIKLLEQK